jgi:hypothetical protein
MALDWVLWVHSSARLVQVPWELNSSPAKTKHKLNKYQFSKHKSHKLGIRVSLQSHLLWVDILELLRCPQLHQGMEHRDTEHRDMEHQLL